jgi:hypothetical protein
MLIMAVKAFVIAVMMTGEGQTPETLCSGHCYQMQCVKNYFLYILVEHSICEEFDVKTLHSGALCKITEHTPTVFFQ